MEEAEKIKEIAESRLADPEHFIVNVLFKNKQHPPKVMVIVDGDKGITIDACAVLSKEISAVLDETNLLDDAYVLEVTTPGLDQPLTLNRQYIKNVGRRFRIQLTGKVVVQGKVTAANEESLTMDQEIKDGKKVSIQHTEIPFGEIEKAFVMVSFK